MLLKLRKITHKYHSSYLRISELVKSRSAASIKESYSILAVAGISESPAFDDTRASVDIDAEALSPRLYAHHLDCDQVLYTYKFGLANIAASIALCDQFQVKHMAHIPVQELRPHSGFQSPWQLEILHTTCDEA